MVEKQVFHIQFFLVDDDPILNPLIRAALSTRKLRRLLGNTVRDSLGSDWAVQTDMHYAGDAVAARKIWTQLESDSEKMARCTIAFIDFDMPGENGLQLACSLSDEAIEMILFTGRQPQMETYLAEEGLTLHDCSIRMLMLKGAPANEFNDGVLTVLHNRLTQISAGVQN